MSTSHDPQPAAPDAEPSFAFGLARVPADLGPEEREVAGWFSHLSRSQGDEELHERILAALPSAESASRPHLVESESVRSLWGWWTAAAAAVLLAVGLVALTRDGSGAVRRESLAVGAPAQVGTAALSQTGLWVMDDPDLALFHDLETFDGLGVEPGDVLALGDR